MKVLVVADGHYYMDKSGRVYADSTYDYDFYKRYLDVFDEVAAVVRMDTESEIPKRAKLCSGEGVTFMSVPPSKGVAQYFKSVFKTKALIKKYIQDFDCAIFRVTGVIPNAVAKQYMKTGRKYAAEVVVDPWGYFSKGTVTGITRPLVRIGWTAALKKICRRAIGVSYVTERYLQKHYPCKALLGKAGYFTSSYSSVELPDDTFKEPRLHTKKDKYVISHVTNSFTTYGKGHVPLMKAIGLLIKRGYDIDAVFVGDGPLKGNFEALARELGIDAHISFTGRLSNGNEVRKVITNSDLFVFPTRAEGLPRVVLEAMAEGLPVISAPVCGIPEILPEDCLVEYDDYEKLADTIGAVLDNPQKMDSLSKRNLEVSRQFSSSKLREQRKAFYRQLRESVEGN